jgi:signal transduction histidine kinase
VSNFWLWQRIGGALLGYMAVTLAATLLAIWWSVWHGLKPLQRLSAQIAARSDDDLSPLVQVPLHAELKPLAASIDHLLARLLRKVQREHAFVQDAAHELRTPMAVISAQAHVLARVGDAATRHEAEQHMDQAIARASHLVEQLLQLARVDREGLQPLRPIDIAQVARQVLADCAPAAMARGIELSLDAPDTLLHPFDLHAAESVLHNLLDNAIRYGHEGGRVAAELRRDGQALVLSVADDGPGIPPGERQRVFERFYRGSTGQCSTGSGLGLAIVQQAVGRMAGQVRLSSGLHERGCRFTATFPPVQEP